MSDQLDLVAGISPPQSKRFPSEPIVRSAEIDLGYRWTLRRAWGAGPCVLWCGLNPSRADGERDDPTMLREIGFSYRWGFGSLVKVNIFPLITPWPGVLARWLREANNEPVDTLPWPHGRTPGAALRHNLETVSREARRADVRVAAWGAGVPPNEVADFLESTDVPWLGAARLAWNCLGVTASGAPIHTLARGRSRVPDDATLRLWRTVK